MDRKLFYQKNHENVWETALKKLCRITMQHRLFQLKRQTTQIERKVTGLQLISAFTLLCIGMTSTLMTFQFHVKQN